MPRADGIALAERAASSGPTTRRASASRSSSSATRSGVARRLDVRDPCCAARPTSSSTRATWSTTSGRRRGFNPQFFATLRRLVRPAGRLAVPRKPRHQDGGRRTVAGRPSPRRPTIRPASESYYSFDFGSTHVAVLDSNADAVRKRPVRVPRRGPRGQHGAVEVRRLPPHDLLQRLEPRQRPRRPRRPGAATSTPRRRHRVHGPRPPLRAHPAAPRRPAGCPGIGTVYVTTGGGGGSIRSVEPSWFTAYAEPAFHFTRVRVDGRSLRLQMVRERRRRPATQSRS